LGKEDSALLLREAETKEKETPEFFEKAMAAAIRKDEPALIDSLLRHGANANATLPSGSTPLDTAAFGAATEAVSVLLKNSANPNLTGRNGTLPLEDASLKGYDTIVAMLLDHGALLNHISEGSGSTALYSAASFGKGDMVELLLKRGANPNLCGTSRKTPTRQPLTTAIPRWQSNSNVMAPRKLADLNGPLCYATASA
jgi:ankyrin repeat protein